MIDLSNPDSFLEPECAIGGTHFAIRKMAAMEGWTLLERIREQVGKSLDMELPSVEGDRDRVARTFLRTILTLPPSFTQWLRDQLFGHVQFTNSVARTPIALKGSEDTAFMDLEPSAVYEVMARSLAVNFTPSFRRIVETISTRLSQDGDTSPPKPEA